MRARWIGLAFAYWCAQAACLPGGDSEPSWRALDGLPAGTIANLWSTANGTLVVLVEGSGIFYRVESRDTWEAMRFADEREPGRIGYANLSTIDHEGRLVFYLAGPQFYRVDEHPTDGGTWLAEPLGDPMETTEIYFAMAFATDGTLVAACTSRGCLARLAPGASQWQVQEAAIAEYPGLARAGDDEIYIGLANDMLYRLDLGAEITMEPAYDCYTAEFNFCQPAFIGTVVDTNGDLLEGGSHTLRRLRVGEWKVEDLAVVSEQEIRQVFSTTKGIYLVSVFNAEAHQIHRYRNGDLTQVAAVTHDRQVFVTSNGKVYQVLSPPTYVRNGVLVLE